MKMTHYAVVQLGYVVFGVGETEQAARDDAAVSLERTDDETAEDIANAAPCYVRGNHVEGDLVVVNCSAALAARVSEDGGDVAWDDVDGGICLPSEIE